VAGLGVQKFLAGNQLERAQEEFGQPRLQPTVKHT
jgi:hypothetical protein